VTPSDWIAIAAILLGYFLGGLLAYFNLRERVSLLEQFTKNIDRKLDEALNGK